MVNKKDPISYHVIISINTLRSKLSTQCLLFTDLIKRLQNKLINTPIIIR